MATTEERMKILKMVEEGKLSAEDGAKLLTALSQVSAAAHGTATSTTSAKGSGPIARWLRIRVTDMSGRQKVNVNLPIGLVNVGAKIASKFAPEADMLEWHQIIDAINSGAHGKIIEVHDNDDGEHVEIFVE